MAKLYNYKGELMTVAKISAIVNKSTDWVYSQYRLDAEWWTPEGAKRRTIARRESIAAGKIKGGLARRKNNPHKNQTTAANSNLPYFLKGWDKLPRNLGVRA